jgi:hypothetical protein
MSWFTNLFSSGFGSIVKGIGSAVDDLHLSKEEKEEFKLKAQALVQKRQSEIEQTLRSELQAKERILVAELNQGDKYTKRARPTVVYAGLVFIAYNYCLVPSISPFIGNILPALDLPTQFWVAWGGICATWSIGRSMVQNGQQNKATEFITGTPTAKTILAKNKPKAPKSAILDEDGYDQHYR